MWCWSRGRAAPFSLLGVLDFLIGGLSPFAPTFEDESPRSGAGVTGLFGCYPGDRGVGELGFST